LSAFGSVVVLAAIASCGGSSLAPNGKDGSTAAGGAGGDRSGAGGDMTGTAGGSATGAAGDMTGTAGGSAAGAGGGMSGAAGGGGKTGTAGKGGGAGMGGAGKGGGAGTTGGSKDGGATDAGGIAMCKHATTCKAGDPPCLRACGIGGRDETCECGTGALAGLLVCDTICTRADAGTTTDGGAAPACPTNIRSGTTACTPRTETTCETACANKLHRECVCAAIPSGRGFWFCFPETACQ
jgi:hypothetical protein